jgi:hypothetical protein
MDLALRAGALTYRMIAEDVDGKIPMVNPHATKGRAAQVRLLFNPYIFR